LCIGLAAGHGYDEPDTEEGLEPVSDEAKAPAEQAPTRVSGQKCLDQGERFMTRRLEVDALLDGDHVFAVPVQMDLNARQSTEYDNHFVARFSN